MADSYGFPCGIALEEFVFGLGRPEKLSIGVGKIEEERGFAFKISWAPREKLFLTELASSE